MQRAYQEMVEAEWRKRDTVDAWARWHSKLVRQSAAMTEGLLRHADIRAGMQVLDLASGSGDPALTLAQRVGDHGHVTATDLSENMLNLARRHSQTARLTLIPLTVLPNVTREIVLDDLPKQLKQLYYALHSAATVTTTTEV